MKRSLNFLIKEQIFLLIPLILYSLYKNGYLLYQKELICFVSIFKIIFLILISVVIKIVIDYIKHKKIILDYNLLYVILIALCMPYNINILIYTVLFFILYILSIYLDKYIKINKVCLISLIIILINGIIFDFSYLNPLEKNYSFNFTVIDLLMGRSVGSIGTTSAIFVIVAYLYLLNNFYYKKNIPLAINATYLILYLIYLLIFKDSAFLLHNELIFASVFVATIPEFSPYNEKMQLLYGVLIGLLSFAITILVHPYIAPYLSILIVSTINLLVVRQRTRKIS